MSVPGPLPLRTIEVPAELTRVDGCNCGGLSFHRMPHMGHPGCSLLARSRDAQLAAIDAALERVSGFTKALNEELREAERTGKLHRTRKMPGCAP